MCLKVRCGESPLLGGFRRLVVNSTLAEGPPSAAMLELLFQVLLSETNWLLVGYTDAGLCVSTVEAKVVVFILRVPLLSERWNKPLQHLQTHWNIVMCVCAVMHQPLADYLDDSLVHVSNQYLLVVDTIALANRRHELH